jgi:hypothetical protein
VKLPAVIGRSKKVKRVPDGRVDRRKCPECGKTTDFHEVVVTSKWTAYVVVKLWNSESTAFCCSACEAVMDLDDTEDPELSAKEIEKRLELEDKQQRIDAKAAELARRKAEAEAVRQDQDIDDELAAMKKRLGID